MSTREPGVVTTVHTTTTTTTTSAGSGIAFRTEFLKSQQSILLFLTAFYSFVAFLVMVSSNKDEDIGAARGFFITVTIISFIFCCVTYLMLLLNIRSKIRLPWNLVDIAAYAIFFLLMIISSSLVLANGEVKSDGSSGTLGFVAVQFYFLLLLSAIRSYRYMRSLTQSGTGATSADPTNLEPAY